MARGKQGEGGERCREKEEGWGVGYSSHLSTTGPATWRDSVLRNDGSRAACTAPCTDHDGMRRPPWPSAQTRSIAVYHIGAATRGSGPVFRCCPPAAVPARRAHVKFLRLVPASLNHLLHTHLTDACHLLLCEAKAGQRFTCSAACAAIATAVQVQCAATS